MRRLGRKKPYTDVGIRRIPCSRCGQPSMQQWQACANDNRYLGVCDRCDVGLNRLALRFMRVPEAAALLARYARRVAQRSTP